MVVIDFPVSVKFPVVPISSGAQQRVHVCELEGAEHIASKDVYGQFRIT